VTTVRSIARTTVVAALAMIAACSGAPSSAVPCPAQSSCRKEYTCLDYGGFSSTDLTLLEDSCVAGDHAWATAACDRTAAIGRCELKEDGTCETQWIFAGPLPIEERRLSCTSAGGTWREP
jgi:hypothetical protein